MLSRTAKSCGLGAPTLALNPQRRIPRLADDGGKKARSPERARRKPLKPLRREGRVHSAEPVVRTACFFIARGPWVPAGTRSSLRPLLQRGSTSLITRTQSAPREGEGVLHRQYEDFVGWAKPPGRANARPMTGSACPPLQDVGQDGGHGAKRLCPPYKSSRATILATTSRDNEHRARA